MRVRVGVVNRRPEAVPGMPHVFMEHAEEIETSSPRRGTGKEGGEETREEMSSMLWGMLVGGVLVFLGMAGAALQQLARNSNKTK